MQILPLLPIPAILWTIRLEMSICQEYGLRCQLCLNLANSHESEFVKCVHKQDSPPARNRKRRTARCITCPSITYTGGVIQSWPGSGYPMPGQGGIPSCGTPPPGQYWGTGSPTWDWGTPQDGMWDQSLGYPSQERTRDQWKYYGMEMGYHPRKDIGPVELLWDGDGVPPPAGCEQTENITYRRTSYAGDNNDK